MEGKALIKKEIRNSSSEKKVKPRLFDVVIDHGQVYFEVKNTKTKVIEKARMEDIMRQIEEARREDQQQE